MAVTRVRIVYYFYVSVSFAGSVFTLAKLGRLAVSDEYVELLTVCVRFVFYVVVRVDFVQFFQSKENINKVVFRVRVVILRMEGTCDCVFHVYIGTLGLF